ncbi:MAG TPA: hypothetical protein VFS00_02695, partial [Polyangiaceae bacterium]|nr:hypothetical protein [Polyangiaceae bacterium]
MGTGHLNPIVPQPAFDELLRHRARAATRIYAAVEALGHDLGDFFTKVSDALPPSLTGVFLNPDGSPARRVSVEALSPAYGPGEASEVAWPVPRDTTDARGSFGLLLPQVPVPKAGLTLRVRGADATEEIVVKAVDLLDGSTGTIVLSRRLEPIETSLVSSLGEASSA